MDDKDTDKLKEAEQKHRNEIASVLINGLTTDGAHHKQYALDRALMRIFDDAFYEDAKKEFKWEEGIPG